MPRRIPEDYLKRMRERYENAPRRVKTQILSEFCANSGYSRKHGSRIVGGKIQIRATKALGWKTPLEAIESAAVRAIAFLMFMKEKYPTPIAPSYALNSNGDVFFPVPKPRTRKKIKRRRIT